MTRILMELLYMCKEICNKIKPRDLQVGSGKLYLPNHFPRAPPPITITLISGFQCKIQEGHKHSEHSSLIWSISLKDWDMVCRLVSGVTLDEWVHFSTRNDIDIRLFGLFLGNSWGGILKCPLSAELFNEDGIILLKKLPGLPKFWLSFLGSVVIYLSI